MISKKKKKMSKNKLQVIKINKMINLPKLKLNLIKKKIKITF